MEGIMRSRSILSTLSLTLIMAGLACARKPSSDNSNAPGNTGNTNTASDTNSNNQKNEAPKPPLVVPSGTTVTVSLGTALGSKLSTSGQSFTGTVAKDVVSENTVAIPRGTGISGTVLKDKPLGQLAGGAVLQIRLESIDMHGSDVPVHASVGPL